MKSVLYSGSTAAAAAGWLAATAEVVAGTAAPLAFAAASSFRAPAPSSRGIASLSAAPGSSPVRRAARRRRRHLAADTALSASSGRSFASLGLSEDLVAVAQKMKWDVPTPVQQLSIPAIIDMADGGENSSLWCEGPTGSGKTGGFALPLIQILLERKRRQHGDFSAASPGEGHISTLILCPTRELAAQTGTVLQRLASYLPTKKNDAALAIDVIHGGVPVEPQVARLARKRRSGDGIDVLVATPGRLVDVLTHDEDDEDPSLSALERRIMDAFDEKSDAGDDGVYGKKRKKKKGRGGPPEASSLSLNEIQEMDLDRMDDDGRATMDQMLRQLDYLVLDEADRLLSNAFKGDMDTLLSLFPNPNQEDTSTAEGSGVKALLFSATFPEQIEQRVDRVLSRMAVGTPLRVSTTAAMLQRMPSSEEGEDGGDMSAELSNRQKKHLANTTPIKNVLRDTAPLIKHRIIQLDERDRTQALRFLLEENDANTWDRVLVFVATRYSTEHVSKKLRRYGIHAADLHGKLDQDARERRLKAFRSGKTRVLVATDLAARGLDVEGLPVVVHYDLPRGAADFTHRSGRTGRAGRTGTAVSFVTAASAAHFDFIEQKESVHAVEREVLPQFVPDERLWRIKSAASTMSVPGATHSQRGLEHDRVFGGVKGRRKSKKDKLRETAAAKAAQQAK